MASYAVRNVYRDFLVALEFYKGHYDWFLDGDLIRATGRKLCFCPITAVVNSHFGIYFDVKSAVKASRYLGMSRRLANEVQTAADMEGVQEIRMELRKVLDL